MARRHVPRPVLRLASFVVRLLHVDGALLPRAGVPVVDSGAAERYRAISKRSPSAHFRALPFTQHFPDVRIKLLQPGKCQSSNAALTLHFYPLSSP
jgi:hypothetical protein